MKITITALALALCATLASASVTITPASRTFAKEGSAGSILTSGSGTWTATVNVDWITLHNASGDSGAGGLLLQMGCVGEAAVNSRISSEGVLQ